MNTKKSSRMLYVFGLAIVCCVLVAAPNITLWAISDLSQNSVEIPSIPEGSEIKVFGQKFSKYGGVVVSTEPYVSCYWSTGANGHKKCEAIFEVEGVGSEFRTLKNPEVILDFKHEEDVRNVEIAYSQDFEVDQVDHLNFEEEVVDVDLDQSAPTGVSLITGRAVSDVKRGSLIRSRPARVDGSVTGRSRKALATHKTSVKRRTFSNFFKIDETVSEVQKIVEEANVENASQGTEISDSISELELLNNTLSNETNSSIRIIATSNTSYSLLNGTSGSSPVAKNSSEENGSDQLAPGESASSEEIVVSPNESSSINSSFEESNNSKERSNSSSSNVSSFNGTNPINFLTGQILRYLAPKDTIDLSRPFAVKITFEVPLYQENNFNFRLVDAGFEAKIDPDISGCGTLNTANGIYSLTSNITSTGTCFTISANNITLDCQGNTINYSTTSAGYGVYSTSNDTTIRNCNIVEGNASLSYSYGVYASNNARLVSLDNNFSLFGTTGAAFYLDQSPQSSISQTRITSTGGAYAIYFTNGASNASLVRNQIDTSGDEGYGMYIEDSYYLNISNNTISTTRDNAHAVGLINSWDNNVTQNVLSIGGIDVSGVYLEYSPNVTVRENDVTVTGDSDYGVYMLGSSDIVVLENNVSLNGSSGVGVFMEDSSRNNVSSNEVNTSGPSSIGVELTYNSNYAFVSGNNFLTNGSSSYGAVIRSSSSHGQFFNTTFDHRGSGGSGVSLDAATNHTFTNVTVKASNTTGHAVYIDRNTGLSSFVNATIRSKGSSAHPFYMYRNNNNVSCSNCEISSHEDRSHIFLNSLATSGEWNFSNSSLQKINWSASASGKLYTFKPINVYAKGSDNGGLQGVQINISDGFNTSAFNGTTDSSGKIAKVNFSEWFQNASTQKIIYSNYTVNASFGSETFSRSVNVSLGEEISFVFNTGSVSGSGSGGGGGGGGSPGGGGSKKCVTEWSCTEWSECTFGERTRDCTNTTEICSGDTKPSTRERCTDSSDVLFDINLELLETRVSNNEPLSAKIGLLNIGGPGRVSANLYYEILDASSNVVQSSREIVPVETQNEFIKTFNVSNLVDGVYTIKVELTYDFQREPALAQASFRVGALPTSYFIWYAIVIVFLALGVYMVVRMHARRKKVLVPSFSQA